MVTTKKNQVTLFSELIPNKFKNIRYRKENSYWRDYPENKLQPKGMNKEFKHVLEIHELFDSAFEFSPIHKIYFREKFESVPFEFNESLYKFNYTFELFENEKSFFSSQIPILTITDFVRICEIFDINLLYDNSEIEPNLHKLTDNHLSITTQIIRIDSIPQIFFNHTNKTASIININNQNFESELYDTLMCSLNYNGYMMNKLRDNLHKFNFSSMEYQAINNLILKIQNRLDIDNSVPIYINKPIPSKSNES